MTALTDAYADERQYMHDLVSLTVVQKLAAGDQSDSIQGRRLEWRELVRNFAPASLTTESVGFQVWVADLDNVTAIEPQDEITYDSIVHIVKDVRKVKWEHQLMISAVPKVS